MPKALHVAVAIAALTTVLAPNAARNPATSRHPSEQCTVAEPATQATLEIQMPYAADFCELISHALAGDVFHAPLLVTPGRTWHYPGTHHLPPPPSQQPRPAHHPQLTRHLPLAQPTRDRLETKTHPLTAVRRQSGAWRGGARRRTRAAQDVDSSAVLIPTAFGKFIATVGGVVVDVEPPVGTGSALPANGRVQECNYTFAADTPDGLFVGHGSVTGFIAHP